MCEAVIAILAILIIVILGLVVHLWIFHQRVSLSKKKENLAAEFLAECLRQSLPKSKKKEPIKPDLKDDLSEQVVCGKCGWEGNSAYLRIALGEYCCPRCGVACQMVGDW